MRVDGSGRSAPRNDAEAAPAFTLACRVYWEDTDAGGVVYHARYLHFLERARSDWFRAAGFGQHALHAQGGIAFVVHRMDLTFHAPARLDDLLDVDVRVEELRGASLLVTQAIRRSGEAVPLLDARVRIACVDAGTFRPHPIPRNLLEGITRT